MAPTTSLHITTNMQIANSAPPTRPLDVLFYVGLGVIAVMLVWFSIYMAMKIYVLLGSSAWLGCCARRKVRPDSLVSFPVMNDMNEALITDPSALTKETQAPHRCRRPTLRGGTTALTLTRPGTPQDRLLQKTSTKASASTLETLLRSCSCTVDLRMTPTLLDRS